MIETVYIPGEVRLAADVAGPATAPLLMFLHGVGGNRTNWRAQLEAFSDRWRCIALDVRGYGESEDDPADALPFETLTDDAARAVAHFGGPAVVVGLSMGGRIALDLFRRYPAHVRALVLADTSAGAAMQGDTREAFMSVRRKPLIEDGKTPADIAPGIVASIAGPNISAPARAQLIESHAQLRARSYLAALESVTRFGDFPPWASIRVPTRVLVGEHDRIATPAYAASIAAQIPGAKLVTIADAGHVSNIEQPAAFNAALAAFLDTLR